MLSLVDAKKKFYEATAPDRLLLEEHERMLGTQIYTAIEEGKQNLYYEVPWMLVGPYTTYDVNEMTLYLCKCARAKGYTVSIVSINPNVLHVSGWAAKDASQRVAEEAAATTTTKRGRPKKSSTTPQVTMNDVRRGVLSSRLNRRVDQFNRKY